MSERYVVFDEEGIIHESNSLDDATSEFDSTKDFKGDLLLAELISRRR